MKITRKIAKIIQKRLLITLGILLVIRAGTFLPVPGINLKDLNFYLETHPATRNLVSAFAGNDMFVIGLFTLNIFPYINASIFVQVLLGLFPKLSKLQKEGGLEGRRIMNRLTRFLTLVWGVIQSLSLALYLKQVVYEWTPSLAFEIVVWLTTGAMIILWLTELITDYGLGNGASLLIYTNIISSLPNLSKKISIFENREIFTFLPTMLIFLLIFACLYAIVALQEGIRIIPLISSKQLNQPYWAEADKNENYIPLRFNQAGVMPIILTTAILVVPNYLGELGGFTAISLPFVSESLGFFYWIVYFGLIWWFSSFYSTIVLNPKDISDQLEKMAVTIPGIRPGAQTTFYLQQVMRSVTFIGATLLALIATIPNVIESTFNVTSFKGLSITSILILAGVVLDILREVKNIYYSNAYSSRY